MPSGHKIIQLRGESRLHPHYAVCISHAYRRIVHSVSLFGLINMKAPYFPFALIGMELIQGGPMPAIRAFTGLACAHLYYFLTSVRTSPFVLILCMTHQTSMMKLQVYPAQNGGTPLSFLSTPSFLIDYLGNGNAPTPPPGAAGTASTYRTSGGHAFRASGNALGSASNTGALRGGPRAPVAPAGGTVGESGTTARESGAARYRWGSGNRLGE